MNAADLPYHWSPLLQTVHLPGVKEVPELPQHPKGREKHKRKDNSSQRNTVSTYREHLVRTQYANYYNKLIQIQYSNFIKYSSICQETEK